MARSLPQAPLDGGRVGLQRVVIGSSIIRNIRVLRPLVQCFFRVEVGCRLLELRVVEPPVRSITETAVRSFTVIMREPFRRFRTI